MRNDSSFMEDLLAFGFDALSRLSNSAKPREDGELSKIDALRETVARHLDLVTREEFDTILAMLATARAMQDKLEARLEALEGKSATAKSKPKKKTPVKKPAAKVKAQVKQSRPVPRKKTR